MLATSMLAQNAGQLTAQEQADAFALGQTCQAPIVRLPADDDFVIYIESPFARAALIAATARMMALSLTAAAVNRAMLPGYRVWIARTPSAPADLAVEAVRVRSGRQQLAPSSTKDVRFFVGRTASHGIIEPLRARFPEYTFDSLRPGPFDVVLNTNAGTRQYHVTDAARRKNLHVCNEPR